ncbi:hypothetical protein LCGC14_3069260 [marine sediment metagenome]|uniref:Uncharacterized protein n=1 Tax=marine sediment metagenome TaxID=412755 RepID=A0A0F8WGK6_9ZZZZ
MLEILFLHKLWENKMSKPKIREQYKKYKKAVDAMYAAQRHYGNMPTRIGEAKKDD